MSDELNNVRIDGHEMRLDAIANKLSELETEFKTHFEADKDYDRRYNEKIKHLELLYDQLSNWSVGIDLHIGELGKRIGHSFESIAELREELVKFQTKYPYTTAFDNSRELNELKELTERNRLQVDDLKDFRHHIAMPRIIVIEEVLRELMKALAKYIYGDLRLTINELLEKLEVGSARQTERCPKCGMVYGIFVLSGKCPQCNTPIEGKTIKKDCSTCYYQLHGYTTAFPKNSPCLTCNDNDNWKPKQTEKIPIEPELMKRIKSIKSVPMDKSKYKTEKKEVTAKEFNDSMLKELMLYEIANEKKGSGGEKEADKSIIKLKYPQGGALGLKEASADSKPPEPINCSYCIHNTCKEEPCNSCFEFDKFERVRDATRNDPREDDCKECKFLNYECFKDSIMVKREDLQWIIWNLSRDDKSLEWDERLDRIKEAYGIE